MDNKTFDYFKIENHFKENEHISSIPIFENHRKEVPMFTIAIPTYKRADYLKDALESAINQTTDIPYEIIVVDNNPERNDETEIFIKTYRNIPNLRYFKNSKNIGMTGNWNRLYELSLGEWVVMLHDDDMLSSIYLSTIKNVISKIQNESVIFPSYSTKIKEVVNSLKEVTLQTIYPIDFLTHNYIGPPLGMCIKRETILSLGGFDESKYPSSDYHFYLKCLYYNISVKKILSLPIGYYRWGINESLNPTVLDGFIHVDSKIRSLILKKYPQIVQIILNPYRRALDSNEYYYIQQKKYNSNRIETSIIDKIILRVYKKVLDIIRSKPKYTNLEINI